MVLFGIKENEPLIPLKFPWNRVFHRNFGAKLT
jgi:hypothetical protein